MKSKQVVHPSVRVGRRGQALILAYLALVLSACGGGPPPLPEPRNIVIRSGARVFPDRERLQEIDNWFRVQMNNIDRDPSFLIEVVPRDTPAYPWESLLIQGDTAKTGVERGRSQDAQTAYMLYAHFRLMKEFGRLDEFLPEGEGLDGFPLERAILARVADAWLLGRAAYDAEAYDPLEELLYSNENDFLDAFILTARAEEFREARQEWLAEDPEALESFRRWFVETFEREPPGLREG
jgi:hypothetical protein